MNVHKTTRCFTIALLAFALVFTLRADATKVKELCEIQGARSNMLKGTGVVVGLSGTGDSASVAIQALKRMHERMGFDIDNLGDLASKNVAVVTVTATLPAYAKEGTRMDVRVQSVGDAKSLEGGTLMEAYLYGPGQSETVYAVAQGAVSVGGFNADASGGSTVRQNHTTVGRVPMGAYVEREVPATITDGYRIVLLLKRPDFGNASTIAKAIDAELGDNLAEITGAGSIRINLPDHAHDNLFPFIAEVQDVNVQVEAPTRVVLNERTGTIVVGGNVMIKPCQVAHGSLTIKIAVTPNVSMPLSFTDADPVITEGVDIDVEEQEAHFMPVEGTSATEVAEALNKLRVTPRDMISIFQALREAGALDADLELM